MFQDIDNLQEALWHIEQVDKSILNAYQNELLSASKTYIQTLLNDLERGAFNSHPNNVKLQREIVEVQEIKEEQ